MPHMRIVHSQKTASSFVSIFLLAALPALAQTPVSDTQFSGNKSDNTLHSRGAPTPQPLMGDMLLDLALFRAKVAGLGAQLNWEINSGAQTNYYNVEKSLDGEHFRTIAKVAGKTKSDGSYSYLDQEDIQVNTTVYYRLKQTNTNGTIAYSPVLPVKRKKAVTVNRIYPNPANNFFQVELASDKLATLTIFTLQGTPVLTQTIQPVNKPKIDISLLPAGNYMVQIQQANHKWSQQLLKQ